MQVGGFIRRYPVLTFYALTFAISWGGFFFFVGCGKIPGTAEQIEALVPLAVLALFAGPSVAGGFLIGVVHGKAGYKEFLARFARARVGARWYGVALLTAPVLMASVLLSLSLLSPAFLPGIFVTDNRVGLLLLGVVSGLVGGGFLEELGWTGFAVPHLRARYDVFRTGLIVGVLWGAWHLLIIFWMSGAASQGVPLAVFLTVRGCDLLAGQLPAFRILMVWVYDQTGSLLVVMLMHASLSASMLILQPIAITGIPFLTYCVGVSVTMWVAVAVVAAVNRGKITRTAFMA